MCVCVDLHEAAHSALAQESPADAAAPAVAAADAAGDAGAGDGADSPSGRRPGYKQQLDSWQQMHPGDVLGMFWGGPGPKN